MKLPKNAADAHYNVIKVDDYRLVAALLAIGFEMPHRVHGWVSEEINEQFYDDVIDNSVYLYEDRPELRKALNHIQKKGFDVDKLIWRQVLNELKGWFGVGPGNEDDPNGVKERYTRTRIGRW